LKESQMVLGRQIAVEYYNCKHNILDSAPALEQVFLQAARKSGATIISSHFHQFLPQGVSGVVIISESHFAVHAWPEHDYAAVDIFTCGESINFDAAIRSLQDGLGAGRLVVTNVAGRGLVDQGDDYELELINERNAKYTFSWRDAFGQFGSNGLALSVEIYSCQFAWQEIENIMSTLATMLPQHNMYPLGDFQCYPEDEKHFSLRQNLKMGYIAGEFDCVAGQLSLMVANWNFFEPRVLAEMFLKLFQGRNYRMQVIMRH
ncbi:MAG: adenosylmethionine decarboxylase, partial [Victivallaceae bacterium]